MENLMPPWFLYAMARCETLALDVRSDRERLWSRLADAWPKNNIRDAMHDHLMEWLVRHGGMLRTEAEDAAATLAESLLRATMTALEES